MDRSLEVKGVQDGAVASRPLRGQLSYVSPFADAPIIRMKMLDKAPAPH